MTERPHAAAVPRFIIIGLMATALHILVVTVVGSQFAVPLVAVHMVGYATAFSVSFFGHYYFTFASTQPYKKALPQFLIVSLTILGLSSLITVGCAALGFGRMTSLVIGACSLPPLSYLANRRLVF